MPPRVARIGTVEQSADHWPSAALTRWRTEEKDLGTAAAVPPARGLRAAGALSEDATFFGAHVAARLAEHHVVEDLDPEELAGGHKPARQGHVLGARLGIARRMVVSEDQTCSGSQDCRL